MRRIVAVPCFVEALLGLIELLVGLCDAQARVSEGGGKLADLTRCACLNRVIDLPGVTAGRTDQFGNAEMDQLRIARHP